MEESWELIEYLSQRNNITEEEAGKLLTSTIDELKGKLSGGESVFIPDLGILEVKDIPGRRTVFFKYLPTHEVCEEKPVSVYGVLAELLANGQAVNLPSLGIFQPTVNETGNCIRVSFMLAPALRSVLNGQPVNIVEMEPEIDIAGISMEEKIIVETDEPVQITESIPEPKETAGQETPEPPVQTISKTEKKNREAIEIPVQKGKKNKGKRRKIFSLWLLLCFVLLLIVVVALIKSQPDPESEPAQPVLRENSSHDLLDLSKEHYGSPAFWVYLYDANKDILLSPFTPVKKSGLVFPDLKASYNVDTNDTLEVIRANMIAEEILKKYRQK